MAGARHWGGLLLDALGRTLQAADIVGARALAVYAKDDSAASFYRHFGFMPSPTVKRQLLLALHVLPNLKR